MSDVRRRSTAIETTSSPSKLKDLSPIRYSISEIPVETPDHKYAADTKPQRKGALSTFFASKLNRWLVGVLSALILILVIVIPIVKFEYIDKLHSSPADLAKEAAEYAVVNSNFPDPSLIEVDGTYYAFATRPLLNVTLNVQVASSAPNDISKWQLHGEYDAMPTLPVWAKTTNDPAVWAPQVVRRADNSFVLFFSVNHRVYPRRHCLGAATSENILGPYIPINSTDPLVCHLSQGGNIDPTFFYDPLANTSYVIYKNDGNAIGSGGACANTRWPNTPTTFEYGALDPLDLTTPLLANKARFGYANTSIAGSTPTYTLVQPNDFSTGNSSTTSTNINDQAPTTQNLTSLDSLTPTIFLHSTRSDGPNIESPQLFYHIYNTTHSAYHLLYNAGCFFDESYRTMSLTCWATSSNNINKFTDCDWQALKTISDAQYNYSTADGAGAVRGASATGLAQPSTNGNDPSTAPLLATGKNAFTGMKSLVQLYAPGGPGVDQQGKYMAFHADVNPSWFDIPDSSTTSTPGGNGTQNAPDTGRHGRRSDTTHDEGNYRGDITKAQQRTRALFIAELGYDDVRGLGVKGVITPSR